MPASSNGTGTGGPTSVQKMHIATTVPCSGLLCSSYSQSSDTAGSTYPNVADSALVSWVDAKTTYNNVGQTATFAVSCGGGPGPVDFSIGLWNGPSTLQWSATGPAQDMAGAAQLGGVPCCGVAQIEWTVLGVALQHEYLQANITQVSGFWDSAIMHNPALLSVDDTEKFSSAAGFASVQTCLTKQDCSTLAEPYYIGATTASNNDRDGWVTLTMVLHNGAGVVAASVASAALLAAAVLF